MTQSLLALINDIVIFGIFIFLIFLIHGKVKMSSDKREKLEAKMSSHGTLIKFLAYGGAVIFAIIVVNGMMKFNRIRSLSASTLYTGHQWTTEDKVAMTNACVLNATESYQKDSAKTRALCECVTETVTSKYTYDEVKDLDKKSDEDKLKVVFPLIKPCKTEIYGDK